MLLNPVSAQRLKEVQFLTPQVDVTQEATLQISLDKAGATVWCGLRVDFGNGNIRDVRVGDKGESDLQLRINYRYPNAGLYTVRVAGTRMVRGLNSAGACEGGERSVQLRVTDMGLAAAPPAHPAMAPMPAPAPASVTSAPVMPAPMSAMPNSHSAATNYAPTMTPGPAYPASPPAATNPTPPAPSGPGAYPSSPPGPPAYPTMPASPSGSGYPNLPGPPGGPSSPGGFSASPMPSPPPGPGYPGGPNNLGPDSLGRSASGAIDCGPNPTVECASRALGEAVSKLREVFGRKKPAEPAAPMSGGYPSTPAPSSPYSPSPAPTPQPYPSLPPPAPTGYPAASLPPPPPLPPTPPSPLPMAAASPSPLMPPTVPAPARVTAPTPPTSPATPTGRLPEGLYLMTRMWAGSGLEMGAWYFSGTQFAKEPRAIGARFDFNEAERTAPGSTGTLMMRGEQMTMEGPGFKLRQARFEPKDSGCFYWDAGLFCPVKVSAGAKTYNATFSGSLGNAAASSSMSLTLTADGRYEVRRTGSTQTATMFGGASGAESGRYDFTGSTLRLSPSTGGPPKVFLAFPYDDGSSGPQPRRLYVGGFMLKQQ